MSKDSETLLLAAALLIKRHRECPLFYKNFYRKKLFKVYRIYLDTLNNERYNRTMWVRDIFTEDERYQQGTSNNLIQQMRNIDRQKIINLLRMSPETFDFLLSQIQPHIQKLEVIRTPIAPITRLEITLRYLASGDSMTSISYNFRVGKQTVSTIIRDTCEAIWYSLKDKVFPLPTTENWKKIAKEFEDKWNFKHCIGALDGKHITMQALPKSGSQYYNYKGAHSIHLLAIADANYKFIMVDIGAAGRLSDGGVFRRSNLGKGFEQSRFNVPEPENNLPYVLVGDEAFPLTTYLMRPFPRRGHLDLTRKVFNYRLSRARRVIENAFGLLVAKWRIFQKPIIASESTINKIVQACVCLHNFLLIRGESNIINNDEMNELLSSSNGLIDIDRVGSNTHGQSAATIREVFKDYFCTTGAVEWQ
ncbi:hypothetical protein RI129_002932 [Pyrocoelia pectoralis]|uniref:DDE Tnp4 domain-containing protein n=1 Tax=Pyrocoelia pectoralis TaxID=417401 RepID=A0AAN7VG55_9COLE